MTGQEAIELIHQRAWTGRKPGLERTQALLASLGNPERRLRFVHITGTNGKGSTAAMTASILAQAGLRAGLFTSPHLYRFHERMQVNGAPIPDEVLGRLTQQVLEVAEGMSDPPTEFELMTAVGMEFFLEEQCDIVVLEVGLGGRLDSTNVIPARRRRSSPTSAWSTPRSWAAPSLSSPGRSPASSSRAAGPSSTARAMRSPR